MQVVEPPKVKIPITASFRGEETVLLVEDEEVLRGLLAKFLRLYGYTVLEARHGGEALLTCERHQGPIHLMVTDVVMPQMSGRELADRLTPLRPEMKILYMSGYTEDALVQHGVADLSVAFLQKPFKPIELARRVHAVLHPPAGPVAVSAGWSKILLLIFAVAPQTCGFFPDQGRAVFRPQRFLPVPWSDRIK